MRGPNSRRVANPTTIGTSDVAPMFSSAFTDCTARMNPTSAPSRQTTGTASAPTRVQFLRISTTRGGFRVTMLRGRVTARSPMKLISARHVASSVAVAPPICSKTFGSRCRSRAVSGSSRAMRSSSARSSDAPTRRVSAPAPRAARSASTSSPSPAPSQAVTSVRSRVSPDPACRTSDSTSVQTPGAVSISSRPRKTSVTRPSGSRVTDKARAMGGILPALAARERRPPFHETRVADQRAAPRAGTMRPTRTTTPAPTTSTAAITRPRLKARSISRVPLVSNLSTAVT